jgi:hypothetical protein
MLVNFSHPKASRAHRAEGKCIKGFGEKSKKKENTTTFRRKREENIKVNLRATQWSCMTWVDMAQGSNESLGSIKCWETRE